jgi:hypothetical protein
MQGHAVWGLMRSQLVQSHAPGCVWCCVFTRVVLVCVLPCGGMHTKGGVHGLHLHEGGGSKDGGVKAWAGAALNSARREW